MRPNLALKLSLRIRTQNLSRVSRYVSSPFMLIRSSLPGFKAMESRQCYYWSQQHCHYFQSYYNCHYYHYHRRRRLRRRLMRYHRRRRRRRRRRHHCYRHRQRHHHHYYHHHHHHLHHNYYHFYPHDHYNLYRYVCSSNCTLIEKHQMFNEISQQCLRLFLQSIQGTCIKISLHKNISVLF